MKSRTIKAVLMMTIFILTLFSFSCFADTENIDPETGLTEEEIKDRLQDAQTENPFEMTFTEMLLAVGDAVTDYLATLFDENLTIDRIIFNKVRAFDANFFKYNSMDESMVHPTTRVFCKVINTWYAVFRGIAIVVYLIVLIAIGIRIMLGSPGAKTSARGYFTKWTTGIALLLLFPYIMRYAFDLNDALLKVIQGTFQRDNGYTEYVGNYVGKVSDIQYDQAFEYRSPEYISSSEYAYSLGSPGATLQYFSQLEDYKGTGDIMRIMRALAGVTASMAYAFLWLIMLGQMIVIIYMYAKRYLMIAFLIIVFPITVMEYAIGLSRSGSSGQGFNAWCMEFFLNVFIQTVHGIIYGLIGGVVMSNVQTLVVAEGVSRANWLVLIVAINFLFQGEAILKKIIKANAESIPGGEETKAKLKGIPGKLRNIGGALRR